MKGLIGHLILAMAIIVAAGIIIGVITFSDIIYLLGKALYSALSFIARSLIDMGVG